MIVLKHGQTARITSLLNKGRLGILPTDTVYGLVCKASDEVSVEKLYKLKARLNKPGTIIASGIDQLVKLGLKYRYLKAVEQFWPGPVSVIIPCAGLDHLRLDTTGLAVRIPDDKKITEILGQVGPLLTTSANQPNQPPATNLAESQNYFGDNVDFYVDGGDLSLRQSSTIIRMIDDAIEIIREGEFRSDLIKNRK